jgi:hypothetical protein
MTLKRLGQPPLSEKMYDLPANGIRGEAVRDALKARRDCWNSKDSPAGTL